MRVGRHRPFVNTVQLPSSGLEITDIDECASGIHECVKDVSSCINTEGSYICGVANLVTRATVYAQVIIYEVLLSKGSTKNCYLYQKMSNQVPYLM